MVMPVEKDPFEMGPLDLTMIPKATREIMFGFLTDDKGDALTPLDMKEQVENLRRLARDIEWTLSQWDRQEPYFRVLGRIEQLIRENNAQTGVIRRRARMAAKDRRLERVQSKVKSINFGQERMPVNSEPKPTFRQDSFSQEGTKWRHR
jgi:hypothetical protein